PRCGDPAQAARRARTPAPHIHANTPGIRRERRAPPRGDPARAALHRHPRPCPRKRLELAPVRCKQKPAAQMTRAALALLPALLLTGLIAAPAAANGGSYEVSACNYAPEGANNSWVWSSNDASQPIHYTQHASCPY